MTKLRLATFNCENLTCDTNDASDHAAVWAEFRL